MDIYRLDQWECFAWCEKNNIRIYPVPRKWIIKEQEIEIDFRGKIIRSGKKYKLEEVQTKIWELYCHFYDTESQN